MVAFLRAIFCRKKCQIFRFFDFSFREIPNKFQRFLGTEDSTLLVEDRKGERYQMIPITKEERELLGRMFPHEKFPRTMVHDSHRHHYYCTEREDMLRAIAGSNDKAAEILIEMERAKQKWQKD